ncbi:hypothetical protein [Macrococcoides caseolyticum]|uniref:hypothetical protein n=1 Tax=Macrococcoides caseolyticum TaxID=69966 RepID=UPI000C334368|nr:hypothetical protein [Macrococcus caseolyticus]PKE34620.1 hypothetical protein CW668_00020 [Macrococcus caseolyticus]
METLSDLDWYEQSKIKLVFVEKSIKELELKEKYDIFDQIAINLLLIAVKSTTEYAYKVLKRKIKANPKSYLPIRDFNETDEKYIERVKNQNKIKDIKVIRIFIRLHEHDLIKTLNVMQNNDKHSRINTQNKLYKQTFKKELANGINIYDNHIISNDPEYTGIEINGVKIHMSETDKVSYDEELFFDYNNISVVSFFNTVIYLVRRYIDEVKNYLDDIGKEGNAK